ncbi:tetratricopeptide repeat protein [Croceibacterium sp. TMG7-5b_MA50]|uniref:tetratricopeptide repeat protein n=1 Tax=Croceibacterium sp. TMG7-5b_MA50 TaxID=3121290 RepID=UPI003221C3BD
MQPIPDPAADRLAEALRVLGQQPEDLPALLQAGDAALYLGDLAAAEQFYARARDVAPTDGRVAAGLAVLMVRQARATEALPLFAVAEQTGIDMIPYAADRGLAYDLVGDNAAAQAEYDRALGLGPDDAVTLRLAISQAIAGNQPAFEATLLPLLQQQDLDAFRIRAFALAIVGQEDEAVSIARTMLPERLSSRLAPYLRYMPRLTRAQQAAAANLGRFPQAQQIGSDDPAIAAARAAVPVAVAPPPQAAPAPAPVTAAAPPPPANPMPAPQPTAPADPPIFAAVGARLVPSGRPLGPVQPEPQPAPQPVAEPAATVAAAPTPEPAYAEPAYAAVAANGELPPVGGVVTQPVPEPVAQVATFEPTPQPIIQAVGQPAVQPSLAPAVGPVIVASLPAEQAPAPLPEPAPALATPVVQAVPASVNLADAFADFAGGTAAPSPVAAGGVDITTIAPPRERPAPPPPPPAPLAPPPVPSRHWVQVATGRDTAALAFDWRRIRRTAGELLAKAEPHLAPWEDRTRLLAGPYSAAEAEELVTALKEAGVDSFRFTSAKGEEVRPLD